MQSFNHPPTGLHSPLALQGMVAAPQSENTRPAGLRLPWTHTGQCPLPCPVGHILNSIQLGDSTESLEFSVCVLGSQTGIRSWGLKAMLSTSLLAAGLPQWCAQIRYVVDLHKYFLVTCALYPKLPAKNIKPPSLLYH